MLTVFAAVVFVLSIVFTDKARETPATGAAGLASPTLAAAEDRSDRPAVAVALRLPQRRLLLLQAGRPGRHRRRARPVSTDVVHTWDVPDLAGKRDAVPGKTNQVVFRADEEGIFDGQSATLSGQAYAAMRTEVEVVSPAGLRSLHQAAEEPTSRPPRTASSA